MNCKELNIPIIISKIQSYIQTLLFKIFFEIKKKSSLKFKWRILKFSQWTLKFKDDFLVVIFELQTKFFEI